MTEAKKRRSYEGLTCLDDFLDEEGIRDEATARAIKRVIALELQQAMGRSSVEHS